MRPTQINRRPVPTLCPFNNIYTPRHAKGPGYLPPPTMPFPKSLPPGVPFLFRLLLIFSTPPFAVYLVYRLASSHDVIFSTWTWILAAVASGPLFYSVRISLKYRSFHRGAARRGAVLPPDLSGRWVGNWDILTGILDAFSNGYPCKQSKSSKSWSSRAEGLAADMFDYGFAECGPVFRYSIFWDMAYCTKDPNVVKVRA